VTRVWFAAAAVSLLAGCYSPPPPTQESRSDAARTAACRGRMDAVYEQQNRGEIYTDRSVTERDSMLSGTYIEGIPSRGLADRYARDEAFSECLREGNAPGTPGPTDTPGPTGGPGPVSPQAGANRE
jgi:hypothetical protein